MDLPMERINDLDQVKKTRKLLRDAYLAEVEDMKKSKERAIRIIAHFLAALIMAGILFLCRDSFAGDLSAHFNRIEFTQRDERGKYTVVPVDPQLIAKLEKLRSIIKRPIKICSGYRSPAYNKKVGGAKHSQHMDGKAADIIVEGMTAKQLEPIARSVGFTFTQTYKKLPHLHVDVR